ncbi:MAG: tetratricopeptide repeat protein [Bacteroidota bacterium]
MKRFAPLILLFWTVVYISSAGAQYLTSARLYLKLKEYAQAEASALKAVAKDDKDEEAWFVLGQARWELKKYSEMIDAFDKAMALKPTYNEEIYKYRLRLWIDSYNAGIGFYNKGRDTAAYYDQAIASFNTAIKAMPDTVSTYYVCALAYYGKKEYNDAIKLLNTCITKDPKKTDAIRLLGQLHLQMGREKKDAKDEAGAMEEHKQAVVAFEKLYEAAPTNVDNIIALIDVYERAGMNEKALNLTSNCVKTDPTNRVCRFALGVYLLKKDLFAESIEQLKAVIDLEPDNKDEMYKDATYNLGVANLNWGVAMKEAADKKAEEERKAQKGKKKNIKETEDLSYKEKFRAAVPYLEKTAELRKDDATLYQQLGKLYAHLNMAKEAKAAFEAVDKLLKGK